MLSGLPFYLPNHIFLPIQKTDLPNDGPIDETR